MSFFFFTDAEPISTWIHAIEDDAYDLRLPHIYKPLSADNPVSIVDIDNKSLKEIGRWPWSRNKLANLVTKLNKLGATVIAFDMIFSNEEKNIVDELGQKLSKDTPTLNELENLRSSFDYDQIFAKSLSPIDHVLAYIFTNGGESEGVLTEPLFTLNPKVAGELAIPKKETYISNISLLQKSSKTAGFTNASPGSDGISRFVPLLLRYQDGVYGSLALQAVKLYLLTNSVSIDMGCYEGHSVLEGLQLDGLYIHVDPEGRMLIPYRGPPFSFPYISASDVLNNKVTADSIHGKLIFIGSTAAALGDFHASSIAPVFPGVEIQASVASGIIDRYLPYKPTWDKGVTLFLMIAIGSLCAILLPHLHVTLSFLLCTLLIGSLFGLNHLIWIHYGILLSTVSLLLLVLALFIFNITYGYLFESHRRKKIKSIFGQYVPTSRLDTLVKRSKRINLEGESKELTILFADIRNFTKLSETLSATELKKFLNLYFTPMTEVIFDNHGTIDKYVGDMIMAFWGAPLDDSNHAFNAVTAALHMRAKLVELNEMFKKNNQPTLAIGIGINTGIVNVGDMGSKFRLAYTALGDAVNVAARLEEQTKSYNIDILVGEETYNQTKEDFVYQKIDHITLKGKEKAIDIYTVNKKEVT